MIDYFKHVNEEEERNIKLSQQYFSQDLQKYEVSVNVLAQTLNQINQSFKGRVLKPETKIATVSLSSRFMVSAKCLFNMIVQAYYYEAWILLRSLQENVAYCLCFAESNDYAKLWFKNQLSSSATFKKVRKIIQPSYRKTVKDARDFMNNFVHSKMPAIARFIEFERKPKKIRPPESPKFRKDSNILLKAFRTLDTSMLLILIEIFNEDLSTKTKNIIKTFVKEEQRNLGL